jgi:hypothetical protein
LIPSKTGTPYFILAAIVVSATKWKVSLETMKAFRKKIAREGFLPYHIEFHCAEMIDPHKIKEFTSISVAERWGLIEEYAETIGQNKAFSLIAIVIDKSKSNLKPEEYLTTAITRLYQSFDELLKMNSSNGLLFFDRANEKHINTHVRRLLGTGASGETVQDVRIGWVIEDPIFRISSDSMFIQAADVVAYALKESEFPQTSRKKFNADRIFKNKLRGLAFQSKMADGIGIIRA